MKEKGRNDTALSESAEDGGAGDFVSLKNFSLAAAVCETLAPPGRILLPDDSSLWTKKNEVLSHMLEYFLFAPYLSVIIYTRN